MAASEPRLARASAPCPPLDRQLRAYLADSYPRNQNYRVLGDRLWPSWRLWRRYRRIRALYPTPLESLVDLSASKGWFVLHAAGPLGCPRALGIDVHAPDVAVCDAVRDHLGLAGARFELLRLHELAERLAAFGGPFQLALVVNLYHYLYFGSGRASERYGSHEEIFGLLRALVSGTVVFGGCVELEQLPRHVRAMAVEQGRERGYDARSIRAAAERFFRVEEHGRLGRRPLWRLVAR
jgi:hypothetical protein